MRGSEVRSRWLLALFLCCLAGVAQSADGDDGKRAMARVQALLKQVNAQKQATEAELAKARQQIAEQEAALAAARSEAAAGRKSLQETTAELGAAKGHGASLEGELAKLRERLAKTEDRLKDSNGRLRETTQALQETGAAKRQVEADLSATSKALKDADGKNQALHAVNRDLIDHFSREGFLGRLFRTEPVTGLAGVRAENFLQDASNRNDDSRRSSSTRAEQAQ